MLWGSRFSEKINDEAMIFSSSLSFDINLLEHDLEVSKAHAAMLAEQNIISKEESKKIIDGLNMIAELWNAEEWHPNPAEHEDVHSAVETKLTELIGEVAGKLHSGRSRNDQVATGFRLWTKAAAKDLLVKVENLKMALVNLAEAHTETIIPGYTHLQRAQPVSFALHLLAYAEMLARDTKRIEFALNEADYSPLGCGALAGSTLPLNRESTKEKLGFANICANSLDGVSDRDFAIDLLNACSVGMMHLSRFCEELIIWSSYEFSFIQIGDAYTTGSSLMPQKRNPDMAELIRGKSGRVYGNYTTLMTIMKGIPLSYNRDMQEDKEPLFDSVAHYSASLSIMTKMVPTIKVKKENTEKNLDGDFMFATDIADWLVLKGIPFREAHHIVGRIVKYAEDNSMKLNQLSLDEFKDINPIFDETVLKVVLVKDALTRKKTAGSPNPEDVSLQIQNWKKCFGNG